jgi:hypothetical protein
MERGFFLSWKGIASQNYSHSNAYTFLNLFQDATVSYRINLGEIFFRRGLIQIMSKGGNT